MHRFPVRIEQVSQLEVPPGVVRAAPIMLEHLGIETGEMLQVRFGLCRAAVRFEAAPLLRPDQMLVSRDVVAALSPLQGWPMTVWRSGPRELSMGPLVGLMISESKLRAVLGGKRDSVYCRYAQYAREAGAPLTFFAAPEGQQPNQTFQAYIHECHDHEPCQWHPVMVPPPAVIYDRAFGQAARKAATAVRTVWEPRGCTVINRPVKITKLMAFGVLRPYAELADHLPFTEPLTPAGLQAAMTRYDDLYLKPNALYKGKGIYRLTRTVGGWLLQSRAETGNVMALLPGTAAVSAELEPILASEGYLLQEGLPLARYLGNRFDFRSMVQKDGQGAWTVTGVVARIAPQGSVITSPRSGGQTAPSEQALWHAFGDRFPAVLAEIHRVSLLIAERIDLHLGPCAELGLDLGALEDGSVKLIEVNGIPLRVSLERLCDPLISERINRYPIHYAAGLETGGAGLPSGAADRGEPPLVGIMLGPGDMERLLQSPRYRHMAAAAKEAGVRPLFFTADEVDPVERSVCGRELIGDNWVGAEFPLPAVIYNRATHTSEEKRKTARRLLRRLEDPHRVSLLNTAHSFSKSAVYDALRFFPETAALVPETIPFGSGSDLQTMLDRYPRVFAKANHGSHGEDVVRIAPMHSGWEVLGRIGGARVQELFQSQRSLQSFFALLLRKQEWVLQQGIALPEAEGRLFDLRVIAQKDGDGRWTVPLVLVRRARAGSVAANMSQGGEPSLPEQFLERFGVSAAFSSAMIEAASTAAIKTAMALESRAGRLGEVGVDIGTDRDGAVWVFEANTKPLHPQLPDLPDDLLLRRPFQYAAYLARRAGIGRQTALPLQTPLEL